MKQLLASFIVILWPLTTNAQNPNVFCWQINPFIDVFCFDIKDKEFVFELTGTQKFSANEVPSYGAANLNHSSNMYHLGFTSHYPNGRAPHFFAVIDPITLNGTWNDAIGFSGNFTFLGTGPLSMEIMGNDHMIADNDYLSHITSQ